MQVVKLSNCRRPCEKHLQESHPGDVEYLLGSKLSRGVIHRPTPTPKISPTHNPGLRLAPNQTLERVRVCIDEAGQKRLPRQIDRCKPFAISLSNYALDSSCIVDKKPSIRHK